MSSSVMNSETAVSDFAVTLVQVPHIETSHLPRGQQMNAFREAVKREAHAEGYQSGFQAGLEIGTAQAREIGLAEDSKARAAMIEAMSGSLEAVLASIQHAVPAWCEKAESALTDKVIEICRIVLQQELHQDRSSIVEAVKEAMKQVTHARKATVRVNLADHHQLLLRKDDLMAAVRTLDSLEIVEDNSIEGGCRIETEGGIIDATHSSQLRVLETRLGEEAA